MSRSKAEKERRYYNRKLLKDGFKREIKRPHKIDWKDIICNCIGISLGLTLTDKIKIERFLHNSFATYMAEIFIIVTIIIIIKALVYLIYRVARKKA